MIEISTVGSALGFCNELNLGNKEDDWTNFDMFQFEDLTILTFPDQNMFDLAISQAEVLAFTFPMISFSSLIFPNQRGVVVTLSSQNGLSYSPEAISNKTAKA